jgi:hypothetical protein
VVTALNLNAATLTVRTEEDDDTTTTSPSWTN